MPRRSCSPKQHDVPDSSAYAYQEASSLVAAYTMDQSAFVYLMDPRGDYAAHFSQMGTVEEWVGSIRAKLAVGA